MVAQIQSSAKIRGDKDDPSFPPPHESLIALLQNADEVPPAEREIIEGNYNYYCIGGATPGFLPKFTLSCTVAGLSPHVKSETTRERDAAKKEKNSTYGSG